VQCVHCTFELSLNNIRDHVECVGQRFVYLAPLLLRWLFKHIVDHLIAMTRMTDSYAQTVKVFTAKVADQVAQTIMATVTATFFEPDHPGRQIQLIVHHEYLLKRYFKKLRQGPHRLAAAVHEAHRLLQATLVAFNQAACDFAMESLLGAELLLTTLRQFINKPKPGVMPGWFVFGTGVSQSDDKLNSRHWPGGSALALSGFFTAFGCCLFTTLDLFLCAATPHVDGHYRQIVTFATSQLDQAAGFR